MSITVKVKIDKKLIHSVTTSGSRKATWAALDYLAARSKEQVPLDTGALKASCVVDVNADGSQGTVSYDTPYAARWHEQDANFQRGRKKKYLEDPLNDGAVQQAMMDLCKSAFSSEMG